MNPTVLFKGLGFKPKKSHFETSCRALKRLKENITHNVVRLEPCVIDKIVYTDLFFYPTSGDLKHQLTRAKKSSRNTMFFWGHSPQLGWRRIVLDGEKSPSTLVKCELVHCEDTQKKLNLNTKMYNVVKNPKRHHRVETIEPGIRKTSNITPTVEKKELSQ